LAGFIETGFRPGQGNEAIRLIVGGTQGAQFLAHAGQGLEMLVRRIVAGDMEDGIVRRQARQGIDMRIRIVPGQKAVFQPEEMPGAQQAEQFLFQLLPGQMRIAVGVEQAHGSGKHGAGAVGFDAAAFQDQTGNGDGQGAENSAAVQALGDLIVVMGGELQAPAIEAEIEQVRAAVL
jgi:hypothetical protein